MPARPTLTLASTSPRRKEMLERLGVTLELAAPDEAVEANLPERLPLNEVTELLQQVALAKVRSVSRPRGEVVVGADTVVHLDDRILGKPKSRENARSVLQDLSGRTHMVVTGVAVLRTDTGLFATAAEVTEVKFCRLSEREIENYLETGEPFDKAGSYGIQGMGCLLVEGVRGCYHNVVGLPLSRVYRLLQGVGVDLLGC